MHGATGHMGSADGQTSQSSLAMYVSVINARVGEGKEAFEPWNYLFVNLSAAKGMSVRYVQQAA